MSHATDRFIVTSAPPNPNGDLHLGHLSGPFLGADVFQRYARQRGHEVRYVGYSDDHSSYVRRRGGELGRGPNEVAHVFGARMEETLGLAGMRHDYFTHPLREAVHTEIVQRFFTELWRAGAFEVRDLPVFWCAPCERYLYEAEVRGRCQHCSAWADGLYCEECGRPHDTTGLTEAFCTACRHAPEVRTLARIVFPLEDHRERLRAYFADRPMRPRLRAYLDDMLSRPLPPTPISREADFGIPVPLPEWSGHILDTWYSGIWGYVAATVAHGTALGDADAALAAWSDPATRVFEFIGFDCGFSHAILWPALFLAHGGLRLPEQVVTNEFYRLEGEKFSTSRGHAIWGNEFLRRVPADQLRFHLCLTGPEQRQTSFSMADFTATTGAVLVDGLQGWANGVLGVVATDFDGVVPAADPAPDSEGRRLARSLPSEMAAALDPDAFSPQAAAGVLRAAIERLGRAGTALAARTAGAREPAAHAAEVTAHLEALARVAAVSAPIMPAFAERAWATLGLATGDPLDRIPPWPDDSAKRLLPPGHRVDAALPEMFRRITA